MSDNTSIKVLDFSGLEQAIDNAVETIDELRAQRDELHQLVREAAELISDLREGQDSKIDAREWWKTAVDVLAKVSQ